MVRQIIRLVAAMLFLTALGCLGEKTVLQRYYLIEPTAMADSTLAKSSPQTAASCEITPVEIHPAFAGTRIALRTQTHELNYYAYHKWAMRPGEILPRLIEDYIQSRSIFASTSRRTWQRVPDYRLQTEIKQLEAVEQDDALFAHLHVEFQLIDNSSGNAVVSHTSNRRVSLREKDLNVFASAISDSFYRQLQNFSEKAVFYFQSKEIDDTSKL